MQCWVFVFLVYDYNIEYRSFEKYSNCDVFFRLFYEEFKIGSESEIYNVSVIDKDFFIIVKEIGKVILMDLGLSKVFDWVMVGWLEVCDEDLKFYYIC